jgi:hypothetical protein
MSDGREEREERERRIEEDRRREGEDWLDRQAPEPWQPERPDS